MTIQRLLAPISTESPCGADMSFSVEFDDLIEKRREEDSTLDQGDWVRPIKTADWPGVIESCEKLLSGSTKDLRVAGWLTDAYARVRHYSGLADGLEICARLCIDYWDDVHPRPDAGDMDQRTGSLVWLLGRVDELARLAPVVASGDRRYSLDDFAAARLLQQSVARAGFDAATVVAKGRLTLDELARVQAATPRGFLVANLADIRRALEALGRLQECIDLHMGNEGPGFGAARQSLQGALDTVERFVHESGAIEMEVSSSPLADGDIHQAHQVTRMATGGCQTRAQALQQLREVADFFRKTEPHSPVAYLAEKAAKWGEMPLHVWLRVVLKDSGGLAHVEDLLGVDPPSN